MAAEQEIRVSYVCARAGVGRERRWIVNCLNILRISFRYQEEAAIGPTLPPIKCRSPWAPLHHKPPLEAQRVDKDAMMEWENYLMMGLFHLFTSTRI